MLAWSAHLDEAFLDSVHGHSSCPGYVLESGGRQVVQL